MNHLTKRAERILALARVIAREYGQGYVGTEHLLLAIVREGTSVAARFLIAAGATEERLSKEINELIKDRLHETWVLGRLPGTPHFRDVLARAAEESRGRGNWQIESFHLLLALLREKQSVGYSALTTLGINFDQVRSALLPANA